MSRTFALFSSITTSRRPGPGARVCRWYLYIFYLIYDLYRGLYRDRYSKSSEIAGSRAGAPGQGGRVMHFEMFGDRKSTRLNSSHGYISYAVFCLKKKKKRQNDS